MTGDMARDPAVRGVRLDGFTLLECLLVVAIIAIMLGIGVPSFQAQIAERRARAGAHQLYAAVQFARSAAQRYQATVMLCGTQEPLSVLPTCDGHFGEDVVAVLSTPGNEQLLRIWTPVQDVSVANRRGTARVFGALQWDSQGLGQRNVTLSVCAGGVSWSVVVNRLGRPRLVKDWGTCFESGAS